MADTNLLSEEKPTEISRLQAHSDDNMENEDKADRTLDDSEERTQDAEKAQTIDLGKMKRSHSARSHCKSALPNILSEYGLEEDNFQEKTTEHRKKKKKKRKSEKFVDDDDAEQRRNRRMERLAHDPTRSENTYYQDYMADLEKKVERERREMRERSQSENEAVKEQEERKRQDSHKLKKRLARHTVKHDSRFLKGLPKTDIARIVELQDKLMKEGKLKTKNDVDQFWEDMRRPEVFYSYFKKNKLTEVAPPTSYSTGYDGSSYSQTTSSTYNYPLPPQPEQPRALSHISEGRESSRPVTREQWAITQQYQHQHTHPEHSGRSHGRRTSISQYARQAAMDLDRRCPKLDMPALYCFNMDLGEKPPDPEEIRRRTDLKSREKNRKKFLQKLEKMHQLAMANGAAATRILARHDLSQMFGCNNLRDVISVFGPREEDLSQESEGQETDGEEFSPIDDHIQFPRLAGSAGTRSRGSTGTRSRGSTASKTSTTSKASSKQRRLKDLSLTETEPVRQQLSPLPLTMGEITEKTTVIDAKCLSSKWTNYMKVGKSVFAK